MPSSTINPRMTNPSSHPAFPRPPNVIKLFIPPEKTLCASHVMDNPYLVEAIPLTHVMEVRMDTWWIPTQERPELVCNILIPNEIQSIIRMLSHAYWTSLPSIPILMEDRIPNMAPDSLPISCMVWNVQGAGSRAFVAALKEIVRVNKPNVITLVETHMGGAQADHIATVLGYSGHTRVDAQGFSGGIWVYWKPELVTVEPIIKHAQHITMNITRVGATPWYFSAIYASPDPTKRKELWEELENFARTHNKPSLLAGDFNETRFSSERSCSSHETTRRAMKFNEWIDDLDLMEVEFSGAAHTWSRGTSESTYKSARLDRALCNSEWGLRFEKAQVKHLPAVQSDHCPIVISPNGFIPLQTSTRPFKFQAAWMSHEQFQTFLSANWQTEEPLGVALQDLAQKLQNWNKEVFGNIFHQKRHLMARLAGIQKSLSIKVDKGLIKLEAKLRRELDDVLEREETLWFQKSRIEWLKNGEKNTTFFHLSTIMRRWRNNITAIKNHDGNWITDKEEVKNQVVDYFDKLFTAETDVGNCDIPQDIFPELAMSDWNHLSKPFTKTEIDDVIPQLGALRAPGPDGYQALFYQKNWALVADKVYEMVLQALQGKGLPQGINSTHIALLPKIQTPETAAHFRPIGLCNVSYKIITKVIVNRLKPILPILISNTQASFVPGRQITDNIVIVQEVIHTMRRKQGSKGFMALKVDFEKAYDRLKWSFIRETLSQMNLPILLIDIIMDCITTSDLKVLWNGEPSRSFKPSRGVRQGDPLSPYLFVMCMERLYQTIEAAIIANKWKPIRASRGGPLLSNLFFADDIILFAEASLDQANVIHDCLDRFCNASGQKVSLAKSRVYFSKNVDTSTKAILTEALQMEATDDLGMYLGMPTLTSRVTKETFSHLCEKIDRRLSGWKTKYLSMAGRITLAKSTISTLANYSMQTAKIPRTICDDLDKKNKEIHLGW